MKKFALLIGLQGSGKSYFAENIVSQKGYFVINGDVFMSREEKEIPLDKVKEKIKEIISLQKYSGVVLEFSNSSFEVRKKLLNIGKFFHLKTEYFVFTTPLKICLKRNSERTENAKIPEKIIQKRFEMLQKEKPSLQEGVDKIIEISCI